MSLTVSFPINVDLNKLLDQIGGITHRSSRQERYFDGGKGRWIEGQNDGKLYSMCYHSTKEHSATVEVHNHFRQMFGARDEIVRSNKSTAPPGQWAIAFCDSGRLGGDKTYYNFW